MLRIIQTMILLLLFSTGNAQIDYETQIQPIFNLKCTQCHGNSAGLNLSSYDNIMMGSNNGYVVIPYDHTSSVLWQRVNSGQMPPGNNDLTDNQVDMIAQWINEGAFPEGGNSNCVEGYVDDCLGDGDCCPESWIGDGYPDCPSPTNDGCDLSCYDNDGGDCCGDNDCSSLENDVSCPQDCSETGDLNNDGVLNVLDIVLMVNMALDNSYDEVADMNGDGIINVLDIVILINTILN